MKTTENTIHGHKGIKQGTPMTVESIKAKIANNEILSEEAADILIDADFDAYLEYEHVTRIADATGCTLGEIKDEIAAAASSYITIQK